MAHYIDKDALVAEIEKIISDETESIKSFEHNKNASEVQRSNARIGVLTYLHSFLTTLEVKEVDLEKEYKDFIKSDNGRSMFETAKHFFELGMRASNPITAADRSIVEEIITSLKQVENDYYLDQTKEIEWVMNKVKEEEV